MAFISKGCSFAAAFALSVVAANQADAALVWYSQLDGNANAVVGTNGVMVGNTTGTADRNGNLNSALLFDGNGDRVDLAKQVPTLSAGTITLWARSDATDGSERGAIGVGATGAGTTQYFSLMRQTHNGTNNTDTYRGDLDGGDAPGSIGFGRLDVAEANVSTAVWHHIALTFDLNAQQLLMYVDGVLADTQALALASGPLTPTNDWVFGAEQTGGRFWIGALDDISIWDEALSAETIAAIANGASPFVVPEPATASLAGIAALGLLRRRRKLA